MKVIDIRQSGRVLSWGDTLFETVAYPERHETLQIPVGEATELDWVHDGMFEQTEPAGLCDSVQSD
jgi:hypothetical protein